MPEAYHHMKWCVYQENCDHNGNKVVSFYSNALQRVKRVMHKAEAGRMSKVGKHQAISEWSICMHCKYPGVENSTPLRSGDLHLKQRKLAGLLHTLSTLPRKNKPCYFTAYLSTKRCESQNTHSPTVGFLLSMLKSMNNFCE